MIYDTNILLSHIRKDEPVPGRVLISIVTVGELEALALKSDWGIQKVRRKDWLINKYPTIDINREITQLYAQIDAFSQNRLRGYPLGMSARNMGKNDSWRSAVAVAATALYLDMELHTTDNDFDHLPTLGLRLIKH